MCEHLEEVWKLLRKYKLKQYREDRYMGTALVCKACSDARWIDLEYSGRTDKT